MATTRDDFGISVCGEWLIGNRESSTVPYADEGSKNQEPGAVIRKLRAGEGIRFTIGNTFPECTRYALRVPRSARSWGYAASEYLFLWSGVMLSAAPPRLGWRIAFGLRMRICAEPCALPSAPSSRVREETGRSPRRRRWLRYFLSGVPHPSLSGNEVAARARNPFRPRGGASPLS